MTYLFNYTTIVTIYTYIVYPLYIVTLLFLLRGRYTKLLYYVSCLVKNVGFLNLSTQIEQKSKFKKVRITAPPQTVEFHNGLVNSALSNGLNANISTNQELQIQALKGGE